MTSDKEEKSNEQQIVDAPSRQTLLELLDRELDNISLDIRRTGWTQWTIGGALAAITWRLLYELQQSTFNASKVWTFFLLASVVFDLSQAVYWILSKRPHNTGFNRLQNHFQTNGAPTAIVFTIVYCIFLAYLGLIVQQLARWRFAYFASIYWQRADSPDANISMSRSDSL